MTVDGARDWIVRASLLTSGSVFGFFIVAPFVGFPILFDQAMRLLQIVLPVLFGFLGSAARFVFSKASSKEDAQVDATSSLVALLVKGPVLLFGVIALLGIMTFGFSNRARASPDTGMTVDQLAAILSLALALLAVTTNAAVAYLFSLRSAESPKP